VSYLEISGGIIMAIESDKEDIKTKINATLEKLRQIQEQKRGGEYAVFGEPLYGEASHGKPSYGKAHEAESHEKPNGDPPDRPENTRIKTSLRQPVSSDGHTHPSFEGSTVEKATVSDAGSIDGESTEGCEELKDVRVVQQDDGGEDAEDENAAYRWSDLGNPSGDGAGDLSGDGAGDGAGDGSYGKILQTMIMGDVLNTPVFKRKHKIR
jgi:hypothetical protein